MRKILSIFKKYKFNIVAAIVVGVLTFTAVYFSWLPSLNLTLQDGIYQREQSADPNIKIIAIDEKTLDALGQFETWSRKPYADLMDVLNRDGYAPKAIGFDILMVSDKGDDDKLFADACRKYQNVVMAENLVFSTKIENTGDKYIANQLNIEMVESPFDSARPYVKTGFVNAVQDDRDNSVRYAYLEIDGHLSFGVAVCQMAFGTNGSVKDVYPDLPIDKNNGMLIDYVGGPNTYETISMIDVLEDRIPKETFKDSIVLVGACAAGMGDSYLVPSEKGSLMNGVEIHANIIQCIMEQRGLKTVNVLLNAFVCGIIALAVVFLATVLKIRFTSIIVAGLILSEFLLCLFLDNVGIVIDLIWLPIALVVALIIGIATKYTKEAMHKRKLMQAFKKYVAPQVVEEISKNNDFQLKLGGEKRNIAVLFVDIRGFTPLSESLEPEQVVEILNEYLSLVTNAIFKYGGTLDKFIGDAAMAVFNAPFDTDDYVYKAVCTAKAIADGSGELSVKLMERFGKSISFGIGINCGDAVVGNIGCDFRMDYTAIGDTVNTAARLESNAKPGQILISSFVYEKVKDRVDVNCVGEISLKGKTKGVTAYEIVN